MASEIGCIANKPSIAGAHDIVMAYLGREGWFCLPVFAGTVEVIVGVDR